ncbi:hypothetical protein HBI73_087670 [Parastagonospora nodorum]|nr:hypothetical protein HBI73_087670 [Parastagonospora nodorum]
MLFLISCAIERLAGELAIAESITIKDSNYVDTFSLDFAFSFITILIRLLIARGNNILSLIAFIISYYLFTDKLNIQQSLLDRVIVMLIIILRLTPSTLLARFIPITKIRNPLLKKNAAKSRILLACADRRIRQCYLTICAILKHYNFNIYVSLATDTLHLLLKGLLIAVVSLLFILKASFALHFIRAVYNLVILAQYKSYDENTLAYIQGALERINIFKEEFQVYQRTLREEKNFNYPKALNSIYTRANSKAHHITIVKQFYSIINKKDKRHNDSKHCNKELYLILIIIDYTCYDKDRKHIAYIRAFSKVLLFNNNRQINNTTRMLTFKFYNLSIIICLVHLVLRDLPNLITYTTMSYYVNNYIN